MSDQEKKMVTFYLRKDIKQNALSVARNSSHGNLSNLLRYLLYQFMIGRGVLDTNLQLTKQK